MKKIFKNYIMCIILIFLFTILYVRVKININDDELLNSREISKLNNLWFDENGVKYRLPIDITLKESEGIILSRKIDNIEDIENMSMLFDIKASNYKIYLNGELVFINNYIKNKFINIDKDLEYRIVKLYKDTNIVTLKIFPEKISQDISLKNVYLGYNSTIFMYLIALDKYVIVLSFIILVIGCFLINIYILVKKDSDINKFLYMGVFCVFVTIWMMLQTNLMSFIISSSEIRNLVIREILFFNITVLSFYLISRIKLPTKYIIYFSTVFIWVLSGIIFNILLVIFKFEFYDITGIINIAFFIHVFIIIGVFLYNAYVKRERQLVIEAIVTMVCSGITAIEIAVLVSREYYSVPLIMTMAVIWIILFIVFDIKNINENIVMYRKIDLLKTKALHDTLTGLNNRIDYNYDMENKVPDNNVVVGIFDINNLKYINDNFGHESGDLLIINVAKIIKELFEKYGKCYRIGGDELAVILDDISDDEINNCILKQQEYLRELSKDELFIYECAYGFARFNYKVDKTLLDTSIRADKIMYENKLKMKRRVYGRK